MSSSAVQWAIRQTDLPPRAFMVLVLLCDCHNRQNGCFPSHAHLAAEMGCSESAVNDALRVLEAAGKLRRIRRHSRWGHRLTTRYFFPFEDEEGPSDDPAESGADEGSLREENAGIHPRISGDGPSPDFASSHPRNSGDIEPRKGTSKEEEEDARGAVDPDQKLLDDLLVAVGHDPGGHVPGWWRSDLALAHLRQWRVRHGLTDAEILETAEATRRDHPQPPDGPKALDRAMERRARAKTAMVQARAATKADGKTAKRDTRRLSVPVKVASETEQLSFFAGLVNGESFLPSSMISPGMAERLLRAGLVTTERLRQRGLGHLVQNRAASGQLYAGASA